MPLSFFPAIGMLSLAPLVFDRLCALCVMSALDDECHLVFESALFQNLLMEHYDRGTQLFGREVHFDMYPFFDTKGSACCDPVS